MLTMEEVRSRVASGAAYLDGVRPGWWARIDVKTLNLCDEHCCVLAQTYGQAYSDAATEARIQFRSGSPFDKTEACDLGFFNEKHDGSWKRLKAAWIDAIADRRMAQEGLPREAEGMTEVSAAWSPSSDRVDGQSAPLSLSDALTSEVMR